ncbi:mobile element protein [Streptomyces sp. NL15-2K]|nr:transposase [Kutzneria buriramensis]WKX15919.1 transposase [Kutzneria buriramensis]GCB53140.1 mobile element protein [Streptomyces sp. NL15-2K]
MSERKPYKTDLTDEQWALVESVITAWKAAHPSVSGHQGRYAMREIVNALLYQGRTGCQWDLLPHDFPPPGAVKYYFYTWRDDGTDQTIHDLLRWQVREKARRKADPSLVVLDTQSVHAAAGVPAQSTGRDAAKKVPGRKRGLAVDVLGLVIAVVVVAASRTRTPSASRCWTRSPPTPTPFRRLWSTRASKAPSSRTVRRPASRWRSWSATPHRPASFPRPSGGSWSAPTGS